MLRISQTAEISSRRGVMLLDGLRELLILVIPLTLGCVAAWFWWFPAESATVKQPYRAPVRLLELVPDRSSLWVSRLGEDPRKIDLQTGHTDVCWHLSRDYDFKNCRWSTEAGGVSVLASFDGYLEIYHQGELVYQENMREKKSPGELVRCELSADGSWLVLTTDHHAAELWRLQDGRPITRTSFECHSPPGLVKFSPCGRWIVMSAAESFEIRQTEAIQTVRSWSFTGHGRMMRPGALAWSPDGRKFYSAAENGAVYAWDVASCQLISQWPVSQYMLYALAVTPDGKTLAAGGADSQVHVWSLEDEQRKWSGRAHTSGIRSLTFDHTGTRLFSGGLDGRFFEWNPVVPHTPRELEW